MLCFCDNPSMQSQKYSLPLTGYFARFVPYISAILIAYGALGVAINLRLLSLLIEGISGWLGGSVAWDAPLQLGILSPLEAHYDARPWLAWAAWLLGAALLSTRFISNKLPTPDDQPPHPLQPATRPRLSRWIPLALLLVLILIGGIGRMVELWPQNYGISRYPYDDEGVYAGTSQLFLQGILPYRDYFFAHPPIAAIAYAPAMAYHFTEWGSPTSFMIARYLSVAYSLITLALLFGIGYLLAGLWGGALAGGLWAIDGRVVEINRKIMLEGPLVLLSCAAVLLYILVRPTLTNNRINTPHSALRTPHSKLRTPRLGFFLVGVLAALSALTKIAGLACLLAILADMIWLWLETRRTTPIQPSTLTPTQDDPDPPLPTSNSELGTNKSKIQDPESKIQNSFISLILGALASFLVVVGPFLIIAPSQFIRMVFFFQMLRPSDGEVDTPARIGDLTSSLANALTPLLAALGFIVLSCWVWANLRGSLGPWRVAIFWAFFSLILFTYSRSFYQHYYIQLAAPFCILAAGLSLTPGLLRRLTSRTSAHPRPPASARRTSLLTTFTPLVVLLLVGSPLIVLQWTGMTTRDCPHCEDHIFEIVARYVNDAVPPGSSVLSSDEQFNILSARPPSYSPSTGYLIDSYGHMIYLGLSLDTRDWGDLIDSSLRGDHGDDPYAVMRSPIPQADFLERSTLVSLIVVHERGFARLSPATTQTLQSLYKIAEQQPRYTIYRGTTSGQSAR